jgi:16S rRNA (adenine1518-N6/adenine1519-N6)-dimethyltransferase
MAPKRGTAPFSRKRFGQNFLESPWADKVVAAIAPAATDTFLEIGPGRGALTRPLAARVGRVIAFEIDRDLAAEMTAAPPPNVTVVPGDFLDTSVDHVRSVTGDWRPATGDSRRLRVAGNLPYNVASPIMFKLVELYAAGLPLTDATLMLQREVADRLIAAPGSKDYGVLSILIGHSASVERILALPPGAFRPVPKVRSALVRLTFHRPQPEIRNPQFFQAMVQAIFTRRRKTLANALLAFPPAARQTPARTLAAAGIDGGRRPETLAIPELARLADALAAEPR